MKHRLALLFALLLLCLPSALAQDNVLNSVSFNKFSFGYDAGMASGVNIYQFPGDALDNSYPGGPQPPYTSFMLYKDLPVPEYAQASAAEIRIYDVTKLPGYDFHQQRYEELQKLLTDRPDLSTYMQIPGDLDVMVELPFLPVYPAAQMFRAQVQYVETDAMQGISFITAFRQDVSPLLADEFIYTFQGISKDGSRYISLVAPISTSLFPAQIADDFDYETFNSTYAQYLTDSVSTLNLAQPENFEPSPLTYQVLLQTFAFDS